MVARCYCAACGAEIEPWFGKNADDDATFETWRDTACVQCGMTLRASVARKAGALEHCAYCDARFDAAALDEVVFHAVGGCLEPDAQRPVTGIRGVRIDEPRGHH